MAKTVFAQKELKGFMAQLDRIEADREALTAEAREVYASARGKGFDTKIMRQVVRLGRQDPAERKENRAVLDLYCDALGMG